MPARGQPAAGLFVIFGGTGDLARRKLLPALAHLSAQGHLGPGFHVVGVARDHALHDAAFRTFVADSLATHGLSRDRLAALPPDHLHYHTIGRGTDADFHSLGLRLEKLEQDLGLVGPRVYYLALPTGAIAPTVTGIGNARLHDTQPPPRLVIEKPFGHDLQSARELNALVHHVFPEESIFRIDHYLGKEMVQNLLVFRFANPLFESVWNRDRVDSVQITVAESIGAGDRARYYDRAGALRDMVQNHVAQVLTLLAMEAPSAYQADAVRYEKTKVLRSIAPILPEDFVLGQYREGRVDGHPVRGYRQEPGVPAESQTETFVAGRLHVNNWRWQGVPFYIRTGKRLPQQRTQVALRFRPSPVCLFDSLGCADSTRGNLLTVTLQPDESFELQLDVKRPGSPFSLERVPLSFNYEEHFGDPPDAYETLLLDILWGDQAQFVHATEVEASWALFAPLLDSPQEVFQYAAGTWGPERARHLAIPDTPQAGGGNPS